MIVGLGLDMVEIDRIERLAEEHEARFVRKYFTAAEISYAESHHRPGEHLAARFAAKEAAAKALGTGIAERVHMRDLEIVARDSGQPRLVLHGAAAELAKEMGVTRTHVSLTHTKTHAAAVVVLESDGAERD
jgi:holo-[acyl-carrier protein] synthase